MGIKKDRIQMIPYSSRHRGWQGESKYQSIRLTLTVTQLLTENPDDLSIRSQNFRSSATKVRRKMWLSNMKVCPLLLFDTFSMAIQHSLPPAFCINSHSLYLRIGEHHVLLHRHGVRSLVRGFYCYPATTPLCSYPFPWDQAPVLVPLDFQPAWC